METNDDAYSEKQTSILGDVVEPLKRDVSYIEQNEAKEKKRRRSSLSSKRRSILEIPAISADPVLSETQERVKSTDGELQSRNQKLRLKPNPENIRLDEKIALMEGQISELNKEHTRWQEIVNDYKEKNEQSQKLAVGGILYEKDLDEDVKDLARTKYNPNNFLDLNSVRDKVNNLMGKCQFDMEVCVQHLRLIKETTELIQRQNKKRTETLCEDLIGEENDTKQTILNYMNS